MECLRIEKCEYQQGGMRLIDKKEDETEDEEMGIEEEWSDGY